MRDVTVILGIDAAWTEGAPSGVAVVTSGAGGWRCRGVAPSYPSFVALARDEAVDWHAANVAGGAPDVGRLLEAARRLAGAPVDLVAVDMPIARVKIRGRRRADDEVSRAFANRWCSTHSPSTRRPGPLGEAMSRGFASHGIEIATTTPSPTAPRGLLEVYPHTALLGLLRTWRRVPYKISRAHRAWPGTSPARRAREVLGRMHQIRAALEETFGPLVLPLPAPPFRRPLAALKRYEDALDALVCAWMGVRHAEGTAFPLGDENAAVWCPAEVVFSRGPRRPFRAAASPARPGGGGPIFGAAPAGTICRPRAAAYAVIRDAAGRVAVVRGRAGAHWLPGGGALPGEAPHETLARELREELGRDARIAGPIGEAIQFFHAADDACWYEMKAAFFAATLSRAPARRPPAGPPAVEWLHPDRCAFFHPAHAWAVRRAGSLIGSAVLSSVPP